MMASTLGFARGSIWPVNLAAAPTPGRSWFGFAASGIWTAAGSLSTGWCDGGSAGAGPVFSDGLSPPAATVGAGDAPLVAGASPLAGAVVWARAGVSRTAMNRYTPSPRTRTDATPRITYRGLT